MRPAGADGSLGSARSRPSRRLQIRRGAVVQALGPAVEQAALSPSGMPAVEVVDLRRSYGSFQAVRGISSTVRAGEVLALPGVNGAGKTSALDVVEGLAPASGGTVRILGSDPLHERAAVRRHMGVVLQNAGLPADLTVRETLAMWGPHMTDAARGRRPGTRRRRRSGRGDRQPSSPLTGHRPQPPVGRRGQARRTESSRRRGHRAPTRLDLRRASAGHGCVGERRWERPAAAAEGGVATLAGLGQLDERPHVVRRRGGGGQPLRQGAGRPRTRR